MDDKIYSGFAWYYDDFMRDIPYDRWAGNIVSLLGDYGVKDGIVCELGCGTGEMTMRLSRAGFDMIGIDVSEDMLGAARDKMYEGGNILYLLQDMRELELYGTVRAFVSVCDSMNYITEYDELVEIFRKINNYLDPGGIFIFDMKSDHLFRTEYADNSFEDIDEESGASLSWKNHYDAEERLNTYRIDISETFEEDGESFTEETHETHIQRAYLPEEVIKAGTEGGMEFVSLLDADSLKTADEKTKRYYFIFREKRQENKLYL